MNTINSTPVTTIVTRHPGAAEWMCKKGFEGVTAKPHFTDADIAKICPGDTVVGILPINIVAEICAKGGRFIALNLTALPAEFRGKELTATQMDEFGAELVEYTASRINWCSPVTTV